MNKFQNVGATDRIIRIILGVILFVISLNATTGSIQIIITAASVILLLTGISGFCAIYKILNIKTTQR